jgi:DNA-binding phage protein
VHGVSEPAELRRVRRASASRAKAETEYRNALIAAQDAGRSLAEIATAAGVGRSSIYKVLRTLKR